MSRLARLGNALKTPFLNLGKAYNDVAVKYPMTTGVVTTLLKTSAADVFAQKVVEKRENMDWKRHGVFCFFGFAYLGCFQYYLYNHLFVRWCSSITRAVGHLGAAPAKVFIDQGIHHPLLYFPAFYTLKGVVEGRPWLSSMEKYRIEMWENLKALWMIWVPAQLVNFAVVPVHLRIPFVAAVSFLWTVIISVMRGALETRAAAQQPAVQSSEQPLGALQQAAQEEEPIIREQVSAAAEPTSALALAEYEALHHHHPDWAH